MFDINARNVANGASELQRITRNWGNRVQDIYRVESVLSGFSGMENVMQQLRSSRGALEEQSQMLSVLTQATDKIAQRYDMAETRVVNNGEGSVNYRSYPGLASANLFQSGKVSAINVNL